MRDRESGEDLPVQAAFEREPTETGFDTLDLNNLEMTMLASS